MDGAGSTDHLKSCRGQGMLEYILVLTVVIITTVGALNIVSDSAANITNAMANSVQNETDVDDPAAE